jgi:hypothetical protein
MQSIIIGRRAVLTKQGSPDVRVQVSSMNGGGFTVTENGKSSALWPKYTPRQLQTGDTPPMTLDDAWRHLLSKYPDYTVTAEENAEMNVTVEERTA